jgi:hypothetical protein
VLLITISFACKFTSNVGLIVGVVCQNFLSNSSYAGVFCELRCFVYTDIINTFHAVLCIRTKYMLITNNLYTLY